MNSRTKRIFDLCNVGEPEERSPKRSAKNNISECLDTTNDSLFNIMDLPVDINDSFLESLDPKNVNIVDNNLEKKLDAHTTIMTLEQEPSELEDSNVAKFSTVSTVYPDPISHDPSSLVASHSIDSDTGSGYHPTENENESDNDGLSNDQSVQQEIRPIEDSVAHDNTTKKAGKRILGINTKRINQELREKGKKYLGYRRPANQTNTFHDTQREERKLGPTCTSTFCTKSKKRKCNDLSENVRQEMFSKFWDSFNWDQRKTFVCNTVTKESPKQRKTENNESRRSGTLRYTLKSGKENIPVCKKMFLSTLGLREWQVNNWVDHSKYGINEGKKEQKKSEEILRSFRIPNIFMNTFIDNLNKLPSHYCRKDTNKMYLEQSFTTITELYKVYVNAAMESNETAMSQNSLTKLLKKKNISLYKPKKDECDTCCQYNEKNLTEEKWQKHQHQKDRARAEKVNDKEESLRGVKHVVTMDLQAVKVCPSIMASAVYFKTKLCVHNFTVYNLATRQCTCYWFDETQADLQASTFASFVVDYIRRHLSDGKPIILYSDGCTYQNRNSVMSNALLNLAQELNIIIEQKYLVKGHTQMECDSVHATIERKLRNKKIFLPSDYARITEEARSTEPEKYEVRMVKYDFFTNFNDNLVYSSIRPGKKAGDPNVVDIRALKYTPEGIIFYKLDFDDNYTPLPQRIKRNNMSVIIPKDIFKKLHKERLKIKKTKFNHLQELKPVMPEDCWLFYNSLPHYE